MATGTTSVPAPTFGANGFTIPQTSAILAGAIADMQAAFGGKLNPNLNTPQGQLASSLSAIVEDCYSQFLLYTNLVDPALSYGRMQDAIGYIYFLNRKPAEPTFVQGDLTGKPSANVTVPVNSLAQATDGTIYASTATVVINAAGTATVGFEAVVDGPISCPAGTLTRIYQARPGWDTVTNPEAGLIGANVESASAFELRRQQSVAQNSMGPAPAVQGAVLSVPGVLDAYTYDNSTNGNQTVGGVVIAPNSLYCCVAGGTSADVAQAVWSRKAPGCSYTGNTTVTVYDENSGYAPPYPAYSVTFERPTTVPIFYSVVIQNSALVPNNALTQVQQAVAETFAGTNTDPDFNTFSTRARIGGTIFTTDYVSNIAQLGSWARVKSIQVGSPNNPATSFTGNITASTLTAASVAGNTGLAVGQALSDTTGNLSPNTIITALGTGSGGSGTYVISPAQSVPAEAMVSVSMNEADTTVQINQFPAIGGVFLTLD